ncbi:MAG TPA: PQQ-dependent sugar dehydrogenase [Paludibacter sp.]|nr:PQQ-dependent sugar dehydrogenase [Paludibacter sp.]
MPQNHLFKIAVILVLILSISSSSAPDRQPTPTLKTTRELYLQYCANCHGEKLERFAARQWVYGNSVNEVSSTIKNGRPPIGMPGYSKAMTDEQIRAMAEYMIAEVPKVSANEPPRFSIKDTIKSANFSFVLKEVTSGNLSIPWGLAFLPNGDMLVTEKSGKLYHVSKGVMTQIEGLPQVIVKGQGGLMDVAVHPQFKKNHLIYFSYADGDTPSSVCTSIARAELNNGRLTHLKRIFHALPNSNSGIHFGGRMIFDKKGYLYFSVGERGTKENAQNLTNYCGKIHRVFDDGRIPADNPFVNTPNAIRSIWSYGHRNPQGLYYDKKEDMIWENEHGPKGGDELNIIKKRANYGWPVITFGVDYDGTIISPDTAKTGMEQPVYYWIPSIAPSALTRVTSQVYKGWEGDFLSSSLSFEYLDRLIMKNNKVVGRERLLQKIGRVRNVVEGPDGYIYIAAERLGKIYKLVPVSK